MCPDIGHFYDCLSCQCAVAVCFCTQLTASDLEMYKYSRRRTRWNFKCSSYSRRRALVFTVGWFLAHAQEQHSSGSQIRWATWKKETGLAWKSDELHFFLVDTGGIRVLSAMVWFYFMTMRERTWLRRLATWFKIPIGRRRASPLYSSDLASTDFRLLPILKYLSGHWLTCDEDVKCDKVTWLTQHAHAFSASRVDLHRVLSVSAITGIILKNSLCCVLSNSRLKPCLWVSTNYMNYI